MSVPSIQWALLPARGTRPDRRHRISRSGVGHLAVSDRPQRGKLTDRITNITKCSVGIGGSEALPPRGDVGGVAVADHLLLDAGDVDRPVMQPREHMRCLGLKETAFEGDLVAAQQARIVMAMEFSDEVDR